MSERVVRANRLSGVRNGSDLQRAARRRPHVRVPPEIPEKWGDVAGALDVVSAPGHAADSRHAGRRP
jgi:hypothetical protein